MLKKLIILLLLISLAQVVYADSIYRVSDLPISTQIYHLKLMENEPHVICYAEQGGTAQHILPPGTLDKAFVEYSCINENSKITEPTEECIAAKEEKILFLQSGETACNYAPNQKECYSCARKVTLENIEKNLKQNIFRVWVILTLVLLPLSILYLTTQGIFYLAKKRLLGPRWLLILLSTVFILSLISLFYIINSIHI